MKGFTSRKFIICIAAFLGSIGTSVAALQTDNQAVASIGIICAIMSAAIYSAVEAYIDGKAVMPNELAFDFSDFIEDDEDEEDFEEFEEEEE